ncbi:nuclear transport factor 2 family protein [Streptomyces sp. JJ38]|uniref:nuclear transport factor 2 family protein n=1 Tax=Streptomyces sp. JJ38 TaxID=2738128 RepID=UPI001C592FC2|nr:nuclear transport factor 2 family protein [Streptomyces sp. JJ38]MBW1597875.1 nuclear transport factor 2 family protein [Streptomyces sp. JJ38]
MGTAAAGSAFDTDALRRAVEGRDTRTMLELYADDAEYRMIDRNTQPSHPMVRHGRDEIRGVLEDVFSRDMTHKLEECVVQGDHIAYVESCEYPDGTRVLASSMATLRDGRITEQTTVQAWDE